MRKYVSKVLGSQMRFEGHFDYIIENTDDNFHKSILNWVVSCKEGNEPTHRSKAYPKIVAFILRPRNTRYRAILVKEKNKYFLMLFLDKHKYYERERGKLGI